MVTTLACPATAKGAPKILKGCNLPLTGKDVVSKIFTDLAVFEVKQGERPGLVLKEHAPGVTVEDVRKVTQADFIFAG
jgi:acyl CoA:acetate/3-ketoacid CoA transferase beta subunit